MPRVMDRSIAAALGLPDEPSSEAEAFLQGMTNDETWAPSLWWHEIGNVIASARRRDRITDNDASGLMQLYGALPIQTDTSYGSALLVRIHHLATTYELSAHDAAYLELAERKRAGLATLDTQIRKTAGDCGIQLFSA